MNERILIYETKILRFFRFPYFYLILFFCFGIHTVFCPVFPYPSLGWDSSSYMTSFNDFDSFRVLVRYFAESPSIGIYLMYLIIRPGLWFLSRKITKIQYYFPHIIIRIHIINITYHCCC